MNRSSPPHLFLRFFRWYCHPKLLKYIEGDLMELYDERLKERGKKKADIKFIIDVLLLFRPSIIRPAEGYKNLNNYGMFKNYFKTAWRNLTNSAFYSALNLSGLTLGLTVGILILLWANEELNYDSFHANADHIYRINVNLESSGNRFVAPVVQPTIAYYGLREVAGIENAVRVNECHDYSVFRYKEVTLNENLAVYIDPSFYKIFNYPLLKGDINRPFPNAESVILTESAAKKYFGSEDPIGKILLADNKDNFVVSGIMADLPENTWIKGDMFFSTELVKKLHREWGWRSFDEDDWGDYGWVTFLKLQPNTSIKQIEEQLTKINVSHQPNLKPVDVGFYTLQSLQDVHLYAADGNPTTLQTVRLFSFVAILILLIASINYVNLSTARALLRSKEVSVRKIVGAARRQLFTQFIVQTLLFFIIATTFALVLMILVMPLFNQLTGKNMHIDLFSITLWKIIGLTLGTTLIISSIYPALLLSSFHPIQTLKGKLSGSVGTSAFRKVLVVSQFAFSVGLILSTLIIGRQLNYLQQKTLGYNKSLVFSLNMNHIEEHYEKVKSELLAQPSIAGVTTATKTIVNVPGKTLDVDWEGKDSNVTFFIHSTGIDHNFIPLLKMEMAEGENFSGTPTDSTHFILNETAVKEAGIKDPIGKHFRLSRTEGIITGVVKDFHFASLHEHIEPFVFYYQPVNTRLYVKANSDKVSEAIADVNKVWDQYNEGFPFDYAFLDDSYALHYESDQRVNKLFTVFTTIAIIISCLGLLGLATYTAQIKVKEIGIRKVLGASTGSITFMLSKEFLLLVIIAIVIATPISWLLMQRWLEDFAYKVNLPWWIIALTGLSAIMIAFFTMSFQSIKAALENPVKSLRSE